MLRILRQDRVSRLPLLVQLGCRSSPQARVEMPPEEDRAMLFLVDSSSESEGDSEEREEGPSGCRPAVTYCCEHVCDPLGHDVGGGVVPGECINRVPCRLEESRAHGKAPPSSRRQLGQVQVLVQVAVPRQEWIPHAQPKC